MNNFFSTLKKTCFFSLFFCAALVRPSAAQKSAAAAAPNAGLLKVTVPVEVSNGAVILTLKLNGSGRPLRLLFDTGADGMAVSQGLADSLGLKVSRKQQTSVVGGNMEISVSEGNTVHLGNFEVKNQSIAIFKELHGGTDGLIGNVITKRYITKVDYDKKELSLYEPEGYQYEEGGQTIPVTSPAGLFILPGSLNIMPGKAKNGSFVFDTGAAYSLICFRPFVKQNRLLVDGFKAIYNGSTTSMGVSTPTFTGRAFSFSFGKVMEAKNLLVTLMSGGGTSENWNPGFDGSVGARLISKYNFTINTRKMEIHLTPNHSYGYPADFVLGEYLVGFNEDGKLQVFDNIKFNTQAVLKPGCILETVNKVKSSELIHHPEKIEHLILAGAGAQYTVEYFKEGKLQKELIHK
ncbi:aspartyl protease family protein [Pedobacter lusitanus]